MKRRDVTTNKFVNYNVHASSDVQNVKKIKRRKTKQTLKKNERATISLV